MPWASLSQESLQQRPELHLDQQLQATEPLGQSLLFSGMLLLNYLLRYHLFNTKFIHFRCTFQRLFKFTNLCKYCPDLTLDVFHHL